MDRDSIRVRVGQLVVKRNGLLVRLNELKPEHHLYEQIRANISRATKRINRVIYWFNQY